MANIKVLLLLVIVTIISSSFASLLNDEIPKPSYTRTILKVSRSLPGETEELKVRTNQGNFTTLIVKRREKSAADIKNDKAFNGSFSESTMVNVKPLSVSTTIGYKNVEVDPWNRLQSWSSMYQNIETPRVNLLPVNHSFDAWRPVEKPFQFDTVEKNSEPVFNKLKNSRSFHTFASDNDSSNNIIQNKFLANNSFRIHRTNIGANLLKNLGPKNVPPDVVIHSEINVKPQPKQVQSQVKKLSMTLDVDGTPIVHGRRVPDEPIDKIRIWRNARVINDQLVMSFDSSSTTPRGLLESGQNFETFFKNVNYRYGKTPENNLSKPKSYRNEVLAAEIYETSDDTYRSSIRKRMLQPEINGIYPNSRIYSPPDFRKSLTSNVNPGNRTPVLQYAHPELGVQPAKIVKNEKKRVYITSTPSLYQQHHQKNKNQQHHFYYGEHRQKKKYVLNDKSLIDSYTFKNYYPNQHFYGLKRPMSEEPFWVKISENLKSQLTDSVSKVSELTKPVIDPLVEATRKISENLGLSGSRVADHPQDKIGTVTTGTSVLIPALGLMASGAALGIGAVAVGRYLDVEMLKRSHDDALRYKDKKRTFHIISQLEDNQMKLNHINTDAENKADGVYIVVKKNKIGKSEKRKKRNTNIALTNFRFRKEFF